MEISDSESFEFYVVVRGTDLSLDLQKIPLSQPVQADLTSLFEEQKASFIGIQTETKSFEPTYTPKKNELFEIKDYELPDFCGRTLTVSQSIDDLQNAFKPNAPIIKAVVAVDVENQTFYFQSFRASHILERRRVLSLSKSGTFKQLSQPGVQIDNKLAAVYRDGNLYFRSFHVAKQFLPMDDIFREATREDVLVAIGNDLFLVDNPNEVVDQFSARVMKYFSIIIDSKILEHANATPQKIRNASKKFDGLEFEIKKPNGVSKIVLPTDKRQLNYLLRFLAEEFYVSEITKEPRATNSFEKYKPVKST